MDIGKRQTVRKGNWEMGYWEKGKLEYQEIQEIGEIVIWGYGYSGSWETEKFEIWKIGKLKNWVNWRKSISILRKSETLVNGNW